MFLMFLSFCYVGVGAFSIFYVVSNFVVMNDIDRQYIMFLNFH